MKRNKSIKELYNEIKEFDLVITNDAPLNTALNKEIDIPMLGQLALTSKLIGTKYSDYLFEEETFKLPQIVLNVENKLKLSLKEALYYTKNVMTIWQHTGTLEKSKEFASIVEKKIINILNSLPTHQLAMQKMDLGFLDKKNIAVVGEDLFNDLDKSVLTTDYTSIDTFTEEDWKMDTIYAFNSQKDIIDRVVSMITKKNQNNIAIVLNTESEYLPLIKARLINNGVGLNEKLYLFQDFRIREYLSIIETFFSIYNTYTKEIIPIANILNVDIKSQKENYLFIELAKIDSKAKQVKEILQGLKQKTFGELITELEKFNLQIPYELTEILYELDLFNKKIKLEEFLELKYFIENFDQEIDASKSGVLLIDAKNSTYINRNIIFYIGMDNSWTKNIEKKQYINSEEEMKKNVKAFEILIQQGKERFFFLTKTTQGNETTPPYYFSFLFDKNIESYSDEDFDIKEIINNYSEEKISNEPSGEKAEIIKRDTISNSSLSNFIICPKKYSYSTLISGVDKDYFKKGELIHSFAEFYVNHKDFVNKNNINDFVEIIMSELKLLANPLQNKVLRTQVRFACQDVMRFIDELKIEEDLNFDSFKEISKKNQDNIFAVKFDKPIHKLNAELEFKDTDLKLNGIIDLAVNAALIIDYKTAKDKKKVSDIIKSSNLTKFVGRCDFQSLVYLSVFRKINPGKEVDFWYQFPITNIYEKIVEKEVDENLVKVHYIPNNFNSFIQTSKFKEYFSELLGADAQKIFNEFDSFKFFEKIDVLTEIKDDRIKFLKTYSKSFEKYHIEQGMKDTKKNLGACLTLLKYVAAFKYGEKIGRYAQKEAFFFKEDLDEFEEFVDSNLKILNTSYDNKFTCNPIEDEKTCDQCDFKKICLKQKEVE